LIGLEGKKMKKGRKEGRKERDREGEKQKFIMEFCDVLK
jgi:hypothetical protein